MNGEANLDNTHTECLYEIGVCGSTFYKHQNGPELHDELIQVFLRVISRCALIQWGQKLPANRDSARTRVYFLKRVLKICSEMDEAIIAKMVLSSLPEKEEGESFVWDRERPWSWRFQSKS